MRTTMTEQRKAKRKLTDINFENEGSHLALVHKDQGGAASGYSTLIMKATNKYSPEFIQKATQVQVTLTFEEFLRKFFDMWYDEAEILATMLGMEDDDDENGYQDYVERQVASFQILKSAHESENKVDFLSKLSEQDYLSVLETQEKVEKALKQKEASPNIEHKDDIPNVQGVGKQPESKTVNKQNKQKAGKAVPKEDNNMSGTPETVEKAQYDAKEVELQKALADIQKAKQEIEAFKAKEKEAVEKAREAEVIAAVVDVDASAKLFKAVKDLDAEAFKDVVDVVKALTAKVDESEMFKEKGSPEEGEKVAKSAVQAELDKLLKKAK